MKQKRTIASSPFFSLSLLTRRLLSSATSLGLSHASERARERERRESLCCKRQNTREEVERRTSSTMKSEKRRASKKKKTLFFFTLLCFDREHSFLLSFLAPFFLCSLFPSVPIPTCDRERCVSVLWLALTGQGSRAREPCAKRVSEERT